MQEFRFNLPRYAFSARNAARAGDIWRGFQEVATSASEAVGWPPSRYQADNVGFVVRSMTTVHHRETAHGEALIGQTWVREFRRGMMITREIQFRGEAGPLASTVQEWVHVRTNLHGEDGDQPPLRVARASSVLVNSFTTVPGTLGVTLPEFAPLPGPMGGFEFDCWQTWTDPLGHVNHPVYLDWCDESVARGLRKLHIDPDLLVPVAEQVHWKLPVLPGDRVSVQSEKLGTTASGAVVFAHSVRKQGDLLCATATTVRTLATGPERLLGIWRGSVVE